MKQRTGIKTSGSAVQKSLADVYGARELASVSAQSV